MLNKQLVVLALLVPVLGCNSKEDASNENFKEALNNHYSKNPECIEVLKVFPMSIQGASEKIKSLSSVGVLSENNGEYSVNEGIDFKLGKSMFGGELTKFCYGNKSVVEVTHFSKPEIIKSGGKYSYATYTFNIQNMAAWAKNEKLFTHFSSLKERSSSVEKPISEKETVILTKSGWEHEKASN
jgi:hypothetical protein